MSTDADQAKTAARIRKLLAKAADAGVTDEERQLYAAKAADLMTRNGISKAQLAAASGEAPEQVQVYPYAVPGVGGHGKARAALAVKVAEALGCRALVNIAPDPRPCMAIVVGVTSDVTTLRVLLPLVLTQAELAAATVALRQPAGQRRGFVAQFLVGYGEAIAERIAARRRALRDEAIQHGTGADLILADRTARVNAVYAAKFPATGTVRVPGANEAGRRAGRSAYLGDGVTGAPRTALTGQ